MALSLFHRIVKRFNKTFSNFGEKSTVEIEDFELEHFLLYHSLLGSSPEGQRAFRDVREDVLAAVKNKSSVQMNIALKLKPLFWEDKLKTIVAEIKDTQKDALVSCLLPDNSDGSLAPNQNPILSDDWRVRANAASLIAYIHAPNAVEALSKSLDDTAENAKSAFCHTVLALASFKTPAALNAIDQYTFAEEPWFRVDSINALSHWPLDIAAQVLAEALTSVNNLSDYAAFAAARNHKPIAFLKDDRANVQDGGMSMILALCHPNHKAFTAEQFLPLELSSTFELAIQRSNEVHSALRLRAALYLIDWIHNNRLALNPGIDKSVPSQNELDTARESLLTDQIKQDISAKFAKHQWQNDRVSMLKDLEGVCLIELLGEFKDAAHNTKLEELASRSKAIYTNAAIDALGKIGSASAADKLIDISKKLINQETRATKAPSAQPVVEEQLAETQTYWHILQALGNLHTETSFNYLMAATQDYAPDKREKALSSLISTGRNLNLEGARRSEMLGVLTASFKDPSSLVKQTAIRSAAGLGDSALIEEIAAMALAKETSLWKEAFSSLKTLAETGHKEKVVAELQKKVSATSDQAKRERIQKLISDLN